ncbi:MAG: protein kinase [Treponema sp.]|jgi:serine/threonine protein kinase|nr:protein kinase [Treponema sp.]
MSDSTARMSTDSTARMDAGTARMGGSQGTSLASGGTIFADGQTIVLNGKNCVIEKLISMYSGEADIYKIQIDGQFYAMKYYKPNMPLSDTAKNVLTKIRDNPKERVVRIFDFGSYNGQDFEIMEYAEGGTLGEYIRKNGTIRDTKLKAVIKQINEGLRQLHEYYKVIYQDLKPENVFFRDAKRSSLVLADFGISSVMQDDSEEVEVIASNTDLYAAPELAIKGKRTEVIVTPAVDYFALGITMYELWLGEQPFKDIKATTRERRIQNKDVDFPVDMPDDCKALIQGLIDPLPKDRMGNVHVQKWLKGETFAVDNKKPITVASTVYKPLKFGNELASNHKEMAALMEKYPEAGKVCLYDEFITDTLKEAGDVTLYSEIKNVISLYGNDREAGLTAAIYTLDPERPFVSRKGKACKSSEEIADAIMDDSAHYMDELKKPNAGLYVYIAVTEGSHGKEVADSFCKYFKQYPPNRALTLVYLKLQSDGGVGIGSKRYLSTDELAQEKNGAQIELIKKAVREKDSPLLVWLSAQYGDYFKSTDEFGKLNVTEQFFLLGLLPFLSYKELTGNNGEAALKNLIDKYPGRSDLFEVYVAQGLPLKGPILDYPLRTTPIDYVVRNFNKLKNKQSSDTVNNLIRILCKLGADVNEYSGDDTYPLLNAYVPDNIDLVNLLLEVGADRRKYDELVAQRAAKEKKDRKELERSTKHEKKEKKAEQRRKNLHEFFLKFSTFPVFLIFPGFFAVLIVVMFVAVHINVPDDYFDIISTFVCAALFIFPSLAMTLGLFDLDRNSTPRIVFLIMIIILNCIGLSMLEGASVAVSVMVVVAGVSSLTSYIIVYILKKRSGDIY